MTKSRDRVRNVCTCACVCACACACVPVRVHGCVCVCWEIQCDWRYATKTTAHKRVDIPSIDHTTNQAQGSPNNIHRVMASIANTQSTALTSHAQTRTRTYTHTYIQHAHTNTHVHNKIGIRWIYATYNINQGFHCCANWKLVAQLTYCITCDNVQNIKHHYLEPTILFDCVDAHTVRIVGAFEWLNVMMMQNCLYSPHQTTMHVVFTSLQDTSRSRYEMQ